jgi:hypothetical protein
MKRKEEMLREMKQTIKKKRFRDGKEMKTRWRL